MKVGFISLGCCKNLVDTENLMGMIKSMGHTIVNREKDAEMIIINTCGFIQSAKEESINTILEMAELKEDQLKYLIVCGCLSQRYKKDLIEELPEVDRFVTIDEYDHFEEIINEVVNETRLCHQKSERVLSTKPWMAYLKIADGCSNRCSYCAIPLIRGDYVSRPMQDIIDEARLLAEKGVKELILIAQDTSRYGYDWDKKLHLSALLKELNQIEKLHWIRILYMYPDEITEDLIMEMKKLDKVVPYFDIPVQHGSDKLLKEMNRRGSVDSIKKLCLLIRDNFDHATLRTTMIVGYPSETEEDFEKLIDFVKEVKWDRLGAFTYSREEDTPSYDVEDLSSLETKEERLERLMILQQEISQSNSEKLIGETLEVLIEGYDGLKDLYRGRSVLSAPDEVDGIVYVDSDEKLEIGEFYPVKITKAKIYDLYGRV